MHRNNRLRFRIPKAEVGSPFAARPQPQTLLDILIAVEYYCRAVSEVWLATCKLFFTLKTFGTAFARIFAVSLSAWLSTTPSSSTLPPFTTIRMLFAGSTEYLFKDGYP